MYIYIHYPLRCILFASSNSSAHRRIIVTVSDAYDAITICGGMGENQIPCSALHEMIRLVKPGRLLLHMY